MEDAGQVSLKSEQKNSGPPNNPQGLFGEPEKSDFAAVMLPE
jgi:hypothetical protein